MTLIINADPEVLHLRAKLQLPNFTVISAPARFDRNSGGSRQSSTRFDRAFGNKRETRMPNEGLVQHVKPADCNDSSLRQLFGLPDNTLIGLCQFRWALDYCESPTGEDFLPQFGEVGPIRLLGYIRAVTGQPMAAEAVRVHGGFDLDVFDLDEVETWDGRTFLLTLTNPNI